MPDARTDTARNRKLPISRAYRARAFITRPKPMAVASARGPDVVSPPTKGGPHGTRGIRPLRRARPRRAGGEEAGDAARARRGSHRPHREAQPDAQCGRPASLRPRPRHRRGAPASGGRSAACRSSSRTSSATSPACRRSAARASWSICRRPQDDTLVARFKAAGLVPLGKTNVPEFGLLPTTESRAATAPCHNPWNLRALDRAARAAARPRRSRPASCRSRTPTTAAARSAFPPRAAAWSA